MKILAHRIALIAVTAVGMLSSPTARADEDVSCTLRRPMKVKLRSGFEDVEAGTEILVKVRRSDWTTVIVNGTGGVASTALLERHCAPLPPRPPEPEAEKTPPPKVKPPPKAPPVKPVKPVKKPPPQKTPKAAKPIKPSKPEPVSPDEIPIDALAGAPTPTTATTPEPAPEPTPEPTTTPEQAPTPELPTTPEPEPATTPEPPAPPTTTTTTTTPAPPPSTPPSAAAPLPPLATYAAGGVAGVTLVVSVGAVIVNQVVRAEALDLARSSSLQSPVDGAALVEREATVGATFAVAVGAGVTAVVVGAGAGVMAAFTDWE